MRNQAKQLFFLLILVGKIPALAAPAQRYSLKEALKFAVENSPDLKTAQIGRSIAELNWRNSRAKFFPSLDLTSSHGLQGTYNPRGITDPFASAVNLSLTQNIYDNGNSLTQYEISRVNQQISDLTLAKARETLSLSLATEFLNYSLNTELQQASKQQLEILTRQFRSITEQYHQGLQTRKDYLRIATQVKRADISNRNALVAIQQSGVNLRQLMGLRSEEAVEFRSIEVEAVPTSTPADPPTLEQVYDYKIAKAQTAINPLNVRLAELNYWPQLNITSSATWGNTSYIGPNASFPTYQQYGWNVLVGLNFNFLDWGIRRRTVEIAQSNAMIVEAQLTTTKLAVSAELAGLMLNLSQLRANDRLTVELRDAEQETYEFIRDQYENGKVLYLDLITSLNDLLDAKIQFFNARYGLGQGWAKYHYYQGNLYDSVVK